MAFPGESDHLNTMPHTDTNDVPFSSAGQRS